jgi:hypothetical protein
LIPRSNQKPGFCHNLCYPVLIYRKNPVSFTPAQQSETGFLPQYLLPSFDLSKKPGFFHPSRKNPVSLTPVQAVRRCEIVD